MSEPRHLFRPDGPRLAYRQRPGRGPTIVFLPGY
ncbi:MAG TPA: alpha/beta hydrolase, partial [Allosphingosinicella sp.]|nr:alpha/beta hydrolase [Allosphingosinicella sp.]